MADVSVAREEVSEGWAELEHASLPIPLMSWHFDTVSQRETTFITVRNVIEFLKVHDISNINCKA